MTRLSSDSPRVIIVGGGLAGLSAAEALARLGGSRLQITLLEAKRNTGGRAGSFTDPSSGESVDYCQHVAMGCCTNLIGLAERCGLGDYWIRSRDLLFLHPEHPPSRFAPSRFLPAPLHLVSTVAGLGYLSPDQRRQVRRGLIKLFRTDDMQLGDQTASQWLRRVGQDTHTIDDFWSVFVVSALGEQIDCVSMRAVRKVFVDGFAAARGASDVMIPTVPLAELFGQRLSRAISELGVDIQTNHAVRQIEHSGSAVEVTSRDGTVRQADHVIVAVPWYQVSSLVSREILPGVAQLSDIVGSPITGLHLWFDRQITERPHAVLVGTLSQWVFRQPWRTEAESSPECYYQVVVSGSRDVRSMPRAELVETVCGELRQAFTRAAAAKLLRSRVVTDPHSVFSVRPEVDSLRPAARTFLPWLHLAGDWIATGWPATMEGAVIGGRMAADSVSCQSGELFGRIAVDPGLAWGRLARLLIRR